MSVATVTKVGLSAMAKAVAERTLHLAWGSGEPAWDDEPSQKPSLVNATALTQELGRRIPRTVTYAEPDEAGDIIVPVGQNTDGTVRKERYRLSAEPTPYIYVNAVFEYEEASAAVIREVGLFMDTVAKSGLPAGQRYFTPAEIENPGLLLTAQNLDTPINRSSAVRQTVEFIFAI